MSNLIIDTKKVYDSGQDLIRLSNELNEEINMLFSRISNMNNNTLEWVGGASNDFIRKCNIEKTQYIKLKNTIYKYGKTLIDISEQYDQSLKELR